MGSASRLVRSLAVPVALLLAWEGISRAGWVTPLILPSPTAVALRWWAYLTPLEPFGAGSGPWWRWALSGELPHDVLTSLLRIAVGFGLGAGLALPLGLLMGMPMPLGLRLLHEDGQLVPWSWGINSATSVLGAIVAVIVAMNFGFIVTLLCGEAIYALALLVVFTTGRQKGRIWGRNL